MEDFIHGVVTDPRSIEQQITDFQHEEISGAAPLLWVEKTSEQWKKYSIRNQDGSSSCCGQGAAKAIETVTGVVQSAHPIYRSRSNFPEQGMYLQDVGSIVIKRQGTTTEVLDQSQNINEAQMNRDIAVPTPTKMAAYVMVNPTDIDAIAQAIEAHQHCIMIVHGSLSEWDDVPTYMPNAPQNLGHCVCGVDYFLYKGEKAILIEDSWGKFYGLQGQRIITESYLKARFAGAMYFVKELPAPNQKITHRFNDILTYGMMNNADVKVLQDILKYEQLFPAAIPSSGNYLQITAKALLAWQIKHEVASPQELNALQGRRAGEKTIAMLNSLYQ